MAQLWDVSKVNLKFGWNSLRSLRNNYGRNCSLHFSICAFCALSGYNLNCNSCAWARDVWHDTYSFYDFTHYACLPFMGVEHLLGKKRKFSFSETFRHSFYQLRFLCNKTHVEWCWKIMLNGSYMTRILTEKCFRKGLRLIRVYIFNQINYKPE